MLKPECRRFQSRYERGQRDAHLASCAECRQFVDFVDGLGQLGLSTPLADDLRARLRRVPQVEQGIPAFPRVPRLPLPARLEARLKQIARLGVRKTLPIWIRSPRYAIAASYLLTLLVAGTLGNPAAWAGEAGQRLDKVGSAWQSVQSTGRETWTGIEERTVENLSITKDFLRASKSSLRARWLELVDSFREQETTDEADVDPDADASI